MEIREAAYELCKALAASPARTEIANLIRGFNSKHIGYLGNQEHNQAFGFLMFNQERANLAARPIPVHIEALKEEELNLLAGFHKRILDLNESCVKKLTDALPNVTFRSVNPYNKYEYRQPTLTTEPILFPKEHFENLVRAFEAHPQIEIALNSASVIPPTFSQEYYMQNVEVMEHKIKSAGRRIPEVIDEAKQRESRTSQNRTFLRHIAAITSIRASLSILNQLIFQKIFDDKLLLIDEDSTIEFGVYSTSTGISNVVFQNAGLLFLIELGDIVLLKTILLGTPVSKLCRVELLDPHLDFRMPGEARYAELREIDENLNPYGELFHSL